MNKIQDADFMIQFPPALKKDKSMLVLGEIIAEELHITAYETRKNIIYANIEELSETWLDVLAYDLHVDWYDYDYPIEIKWEVIKDSIRIHQKLGTKYAVETALRNVYRDAGVSEWFEYGGKPYYFKINVDTSTSGFAEGAYLDIISKVQFYKNLRSHCEGIYISLGSSAVIGVAAGSGIGAVLKVKARTIDKIETKNSLRVMSDSVMQGTLKVKARTVDKIESGGTLHAAADSAVGGVLKVKPALAGKLQGQGILSIPAGVTEINRLKIKAGLPENLTVKIPVKTAVCLKAGNELAVKRGT